MEEEHCAEIYLKKINDKRNDRKREQNTKKNRDEERQRSKHKESRKSERRESRDKEENIQRQGTGEDVRIVKREEESKRNDNEGEVMNHANSVNIVQTPPSCQENWIMKEEKSEKSIKSAVAHNRWASVDPVSKVRSRNDKYDTGHGQFRGKRDSRGGGEKILDRSEKVVLSGTHPELRKGGSEKHRAASEEWRSWMDPYISPSSRPPKYSLEKEEEVTKHHERQYCASPESFTERNSRIAHIMHSNLSNPEPKVNHRRVDKPQWAEAKDPNTTRPERQRSPDVHLYMSELAPPHSLESESPSPTLRTDIWPSAGHTRRKSRRSKEDIGVGHSAPAIHAPDEEILNDDTMKTTSEIPRGTAVEVGSDGRSREDKCSSGRRGERDYKWGGEKILGRWEKGEHQASREGRSEDRLVERGSWGDLYINPSSRLPKHSDLVAPKYGEEVRCDPEKHSGPCGKPAEPNLSTSLKTGCTVTTHILSPEVRRKHLKNRSLSAAKEWSNIQPEVRPRTDAELTISRSHPTMAAEQVPHTLGDAPLPPEYLARKTRKGSRDKNTVVASAAESWGGRDTGSAAVQASDGYGEGNINRAEGPRCAENLEQGFSPEIQSKAKHRDWCPENAKKENNHRSRRPNSRRPRYSYNSTHMDRESANQSISPYSQKTTDHVFTITKSNRKLMKYTSSLQEQRLAFSDFVSLAKQLETAISMQPMSAYGSPNQLSLSSAGPIKDNQQDISHGPDFDGTALTCKTPDPEDHTELSAANSQQRPHRQSQRDLYCEPLLHDLPDDREQEEPSADVKLTFAHSSPSLRQRATPSQGRALSDGTVCVDVPRPIVSASWKNGTAVVSSEILPSPGNFEHQHQEPQKRSWQTRKRYQEEARAALMIQAVWKGHQTRAQVRKQIEAAIIIQAAYRGYRIRKVLTDISSANEMDELNDVQDGERQDSGYSVIFLEERSHSDYSESEADSGEDWLESSDSMITGSPDSHGGGNANHEASSTYVHWPNPLLQ